jgi:hypothetical protein
MPGTPSAYGERLYAAVDPHIHNESPPLLLQGKLRDLC